MKTIKLSLVAIAAMSMVSTSSAASLKEALTNGKVSGAFQAYNFSRDYGSGSANKDAQITTLGFDLSYETGSFYGFGLKATFQAAGSPWANETAKTSRYRNDMYGSGSQLSEMYLSYAIANTTAKVGRMYMGTKLLSGSGSRVTKEAFQGAMLTNKDLPDTTITVAYANRLQARTDGDGNIGKFTTKTTGWYSGTFEDGAYTIDVTNNSIQNVTLSANYLDVVDEFETAYFEASYKQDIFGLATQYYYSDVDSASEDANLIGVKGDVTLGDLNLLAAYVTVSDEASVIPGLGNGADLAYTWSEIFSDQYRKDQDSYKLAATYNINKNAYVGASYVNEDDKANNKEYGMTALKASYSFSGELKGLNIWAAYEMGSKDLKDDGMRIKLNYTF